MYCAAHALDALGVAFMTFLHILNGVMHQYRSIATGHLGQKLLAQYGSYSMSHSSALYVLGICLESVM